jgi:hypothetical protein
MICDLGVLLLRIYHLKVVAPTTIMVFYPGQGVMLSVFLNRPQIAAIQTPTIVGPTFTVAPRL